jgi:hypothetical protein
MSITETLLAVLAGAAGGIIFYAGLIMLQVELGTRGGRHRSGSPIPAAPAVQAPLQPLHTGQATGTPEVQPTRPPITYSPLCWRACGSAATNHDHAPWCLNYEGK